MKRTKMPSMLTFRARAGIMKFVDFKVSLIAYSAGDQLDGIVRLGELAPQSGEPVVLKKIIVIDKDDQEVKLTLLFFNKEPIVASVDNAPLDIIMGELEEKLIAKAVIDSKNTNNTDYTALLNNAIASKEFDVSIPFSEFSNDIWVVAMIDSAATFTTEDSLKLKFYFEA